MADVPEKAAPAAQKPVQPSVKWETEEAPAHSNYVLLHSGPDGFLLHFCQMSRPPKDYPDDKPEAIICSSVHLSPAVFFNTALLLAKGWNEQLDRGTFEGPQLDVTVRDKESQNASAAAS